MKEPKHPVLTAVSILIATLLGLVGIYFADRYSDPRCLLVGFGLSSIIWIVIIVSRSRRNVSIFAEESYSYTFDNEGYAFDVDEENSFQNPA